MAGLGTGELLIVLVIILVIFGGAKLPKLARSLGEAKREFSVGLEEDEREKRERDAQIPPPSTP